MVSEIDLAWRRGIRPEPPILVSDWADRHRILPTTAAEPGRWRTDRTPDLRAVKAALFTGFITDPSGTAGGLSGNNTGGALTVGMETGSLIPLPPGTDIATEIAGNSTSSVAVRLNGVATAAA